MTDSRIGVADFIRQLRSDLEDSMAEGEGRKIRFEVAELDLELQVTATTDVAAGGKGGAGIKLGIFSWGAEADARAAHASGRVQTVRMKLAAFEDDSKGGRKLVKLSGKTG